MRKFLFPLLAGFLITCLGDIRLDRKTENLEPPPHWSVNFDYASLDEMMKIYNPEKLKDGFNKMKDSEEIFFISNPALGLWSYKNRFTE